MFSERSLRHFGKDLYNTNKNRNPTNTHNFDFNCGGYALGTISWYLPSETQEVWGCCWDDWDEQTVRNITAMAVAYMLADFSDLRVITHLREVRHDEYAIAFRVSSDGDFHYIKQGRSRMWTHKCGGTSIRKMTRWEVFNTDWCGRYDGPIVLFAKKRA